MPPQSTSVSVPSARPSLQVACARQTPLWQALLWQSPLPAQVFPAAQRLHVVGPPQSTSVSPWFRMLSTQFGATTCAACA